jgi:hypothetical protein
MLKSFLICLSPALLAYAIMLVEIATNNSLKSDVWAEIVKFLFGFGAILAGACVARHVYHTSPSREDVKWVLVILTFFGVAAVYFAMAMAGCCGLVILGDVR